MFELRDAVERIWKDVSFECLQAALGTLDIGTIAYLANDSLQ